MGTCPRCPSSHLTQIESAIAPNAGWTCNSCGLKMRHSKSKAVPVIAISLGGLFTLIFGIAAVKGIMAAGDQPGGDDKPHVWALVWAAWVLAIALIVLIWSIRQFRLPAPTVGETAAESQHQSAGEKRGAKTKPDSELDDEPDEFLRRLSEQS